MIRLNAYSLRDGTRLCGLPAGDCQWAQSWNEPGSMDVTIPMDDSLATLDLDTVLIEQQTALALLDGDRIIHAGPILESPSWDAESRTLTVSCGGGWSLLEWRLVLDPQLTGRTIDGEIVIDEDNPGPEWTVAYQGSTGRIARDLIRLAQRWGDLPLDMDRYEGSGDDVLQWDGWEFATVSDALTDATGRQGGGQLRFDPYLTSDGRLRWRVRWSADGVSDRSEPFRWNAALPGQRVRFLGCGSGGNPWINEIWASGGRSEDVLYMYRLRDEPTLSATGMLVQAGDANAGTGDSMAALHAYARSRLSSSRRDRTWNLQVGAEWAPHVGDRVLLRVDDPFLHSWRADGTRTGVVVALLITDVSGDTGDDWLDVSCRQTGESVDGVASAATDPLRLLARRLRSADRVMSRAAAPARSQTYQVVRKIEELRRDSRDGGA